MTLASSSLVNVVYKKEDIFGEIPTAGAARNLRVTGESLDYAINKEASAEIVSNRTTSSMVLLSGSASGGVETEVSYLEYDELLEATLQSSFLPCHGAGNNGESGQFNCTFTSTQIIMPENSNNFEFSDLALSVGQFIRVKDTGGVNDGKVARVSTITDRTITVEGTPFTAVVSERQNVRLSSSRLGNGKTQSSFTLERQSTDINEYWAYKGMTPSSLAVNISANARSTFSFSFMGSGFTRGQTSNFAEDTALPSKNYPIHTGESGTACTLWLDGLPLDGTYAQSLTFNYDNALREQMAICSLGAVGMGSGTIAATGTLEIYFSSGALYEKFANNETVELTFSSFDDSNNGYVFTIPRACFTKVSTAAGGKDSDMMLSLEFTALNDSTLAGADGLGGLIQIDRVGAAAV